MELIEMLKDKTDIELEDELIELRRIERKYEKYHRPQVQNNIQEFLDEFPTDEKRKTRIKILIEKIKEAKLKQDKSVLKKLFTEFQIVKGLRQEISPDMVQQARDYPITNLIKSRNGMAVCPFHDDHTPSMDVRNNFYYCHGCGEHGDVIEFVMKRNNIPFPQAVAKLLS